MKTDGRYLGALPRFAREQLCCLPLARSLGAPGDMMIENAFDRKRFLTGLLP